MNTASQESRIAPGGRLAGDLRWAAWAIRRTAANRIRRIVHAGDLNIGPRFGRHDDSVGQLDQILGMHGFLLRVASGNHENGGVLVAAPPDEIALVLWAHKAPGAGSWRTQRDDCACGLTAVWATRRRFGLWAALDRP